MKRIVALTLCMLLVAAFVFTGCSKDSGTPAADEPSAPAEEPVDEPGDEPAEDITLDVWHIWTTETDSQIDALNAAVDAVVAAYPNISLELTGTETNTYKTVLPTALATDEAPDIFYYWGAGMAGAEVEAGHVLDITDYYEADAELQAKLPQSALYYTTFNDRIYGLTFSLNLGCLYANTEIFESSGVKIPETYDEMLSAAEQLSAAGIVPMSLGGASLWPVLHQMGGLCIKEAGADACNAALNGTGSFNTPEFIEAARKFQELAAAGMYSDSVMSVDYDTSCAAFQNEEAAMLFMGTWAISGVDENSGNPVGGKVQVMPWPDPGNGYENDFFGGSVDSFYISSKTEYPEECFDAMSLLCETMSKEGYKLGSFMPIWDVSDVEADVSQTFKDAIEMSSAAEGYTLWWDTFLGNEKGNTCNQYCVALLTGEMTPEEFVVAMDAVVAE